MMSLMTTRAATAARSDARHLRELRSTWLVLLHGTAMHTLRGDGAGSVDTLVVMARIRTTRCARERCSSPALRDRRSRPAIRRGVGGVTLVERRRPPTSASVHLVLDGSRVCSRRRRRGWNVHDAPIARIYQVLERRRTVYLTAPGLRHAIPATVCADLVLRLPGQPCALPARRRRWSRAFLGREHILGAVMLMFSSTKSHESRTRSSRPELGRGEPADAAMLQKLFNQRLLALGCI